MQVFTWETREQRKPLKREASWRGGRHWWGERRGDSWERGGGRKKGQRERERDELVYLVFISAEWSGDHSSLCIYSLQVQSFSNHRRVFVFMRKTQKLIPLTDFFDNLICRMSECWNDGALVVIHSKKLIIQNHGTMPKHSENLELCYMFTDLNGWCRD